MVVILTDEQIEALKRGEVIKVESVVPIPAHGTFGIATQKWKDGFEEARLGVDLSWSFPYRKNYREKYVKGEELYL